MGFEAHSGDVIAPDRLRLQPGSHRSPRDGVCVVELASVLAGERFSDRPHCVCDVIAAYLRAWNDRAGYADRQRLAPYATRIVGTRGSRAVTVARRDTCLIWSGAKLGGPPLRRLASRLAVRLRILVLLGLRPAVRIDAGAGEYAARVVFASQDEEGAFALLDRLLAIGGGSEPAPLADAVAGAPQERVAAPIRELAGHAQVPGGEERRNGSNHNGHPGYLGRRDPGQRHEEAIEHDGAGGRDPEREAEVAEHVHIGTR
jgi:hypothetical protein